MRKQKPSLWKKLFGGAIAPVTDPQEVGAVIIDSATDEISSWDSDFNE